MVKYKGGVKGKVKMLKKPIKLGFKIYSVLLVLYSKLQNSCYAPRQK